MKKNNLKKLALKKNVVAELNKTQMGQVGGAGSIITCPCITEYPTHPCQNSIVANICVQG